MAVMLAGWSADGSAQEYIACASVGMQLGTARRQHGHRVAAVGEVVSKQLFDDSETQYFEISSAVGWVEDLKALAVVDEADWVCKGVRFVSVMQQRLQHADFDGDHHGVGVRLHAISGLQPLDVANVRKYLHSMANVMLAKLVQHRPLLAASGCSLIDLV